MLTKEFFPALVRNPDCVFLDNAATTQIHESVINQVTECYTRGKASPGRGDYAWANSANSDVEYARQSIATWMNWDPAGVIFTTGATQGLNWVSEWTRDVDCVVISEREHNANIVPWLAQGRSVENGRLAILPNLDKLHVDFNIAEFLNKLPPRSLFSLSTVSNVTGTLPGGYLQVIALIKAMGHMVCLDISQSILSGITPKNSLSLASSLTSLLSYADWVVFSGHKMYGPNGTGVLLTRADPNELRTLVYGGGSVTDVTMSSVLYTHAPWRHMTGTPNWPGFVGLGVAAELLRFHGGTINDVFNVDFGTLLGSLSPVLEPVIAHNFILPTQTIFSYTVNSDYISPYDISQRLSDDYKIFVRAGRLCAHPYVDQLSDGKGVLRVSVAHYTTPNDIMKFVNAVNEIIEDLL